MAQVATFEHFRPSRRADGLSWTQVRLEEAVDLTADDPWSLVAVLDLEPVDSDPEAPALRTITHQVAGSWARLTFLDADGGEDTPVVVSRSSHPFRPTVPEIGRTLRGRTYSKGKVDPDEPMKAVAGGILLGEFTDETTPTAKEVDEEITSGCNDVVEATGSVPGELIPQAREVAVLKTAARLERSYIPTQSEDTRSIFQTLRLSAAEALDKLGQDVQWWTLANRQPATRWLP